MSLRCNKKVYRIATQNDNRKNEEVPAKGREIACKLLSCVRTQSVL